jgi:hypothetical protein
MFPIFFHLLLSEDRILFCGLIKISHNLIYKLHSWLEFGELEDVFNKELEAVRIVKCVNYVLHFVCRLEEIINLKYGFTGICSNKINKIKIIVSSSKKIFVTAASQLHKAISMVMAYTRTDVLVF